MINPRPEVRVVIVDWQFPTLVPEWMEQAVCAGVDPETMYPEKGEPSNAAKRICRDCPVKSECLEFALQHNEHYGIWGMTSERERRAIRRKRAAA